MTHDDPLRTDDNAAAVEPATPAPVTPSERHDIIDIVRGFALFGVLLANMVLTTQWWSITAEQRDSLPTAPLDRIGDVLVTTFVDHKFYTLFSMLFGLGFAVQLTRATSRGRSVIPTYVRRLTILLLLGVAHAVLIWSGDVLHVYALLGFVLILFRRASDRTILFWTIALATIGVLMPIAHWLVMMSHPGSGSAFDWVQFRADQFDAVMHGGVQGIIEANWDRLVMLYSSFGLEPDGFINWYVTILWKFLLGFYIGRRLLLQRAEQHIELFRRILPWALVVGLIGNAYFGASLVIFDTWLPAESSALVLTWIPVEVAVLALSMAYLCILVLLHHKPETRRLVGLLAPVGRMALTNYLMHSFFFIVLFYGVGFGLLGKVGVSGCIVISVAIFAAQIAVSAWWLRVFRFGPMEWAWRSLTYGKFQPFRVASETR